MTGLIASHLGLPAPDHAWRACVCACSIGRPRQRLRHDADEALPVLALLSHTTLPIQVAVGDVSAAIDNHLHSALLITSSKGRNRKAFDYRNQLKEPTQELDGSIFTWQAGMYHMVNLN